MIKNLETIRCAKNLSRSKLAKESGVSRATIWRLETLEDIDVKAKTVNKLTKALNCTAGELL